MTPLTLALGAIGVLVGSGAVSLLLARRSPAASLVAVVGAAGACALGLWSSIDALCGGFVGRVAVTWSVPGGSFVVGLDPLSAFFLVPVFALGGLSAIYGRAYLAGHPSRRSAAMAGAAFNLLLAAIAMVLLARHAMVFLVAYEAMTLLAYLLVTFEHQDATVRRAGWTYLIASHVALMALFVLFLLMGDLAGGSLDFASFAVLLTASPGAATWMFALALVGFGTKAGVIGLHVWLPEAHAAAPSHVSALMSGVLLKVGIYGLLRVILLLPPVAAFGAVLMGLGLAGAVVGIALALYQRDLKRALAYSSVENIGIVLTGLGLGLWARARGETLLATFGFAGGLLHIWNHAAMKGLLFLGAGSVLHGAGSKDVERLGGLLRRMPFTGSAMIFGGVAIAALPPLNGFVGEWLLYRGLMAAGVRYGGWGSLAALSGVATLALVGGLAALCFVRLIGVALLGQPRSAGAAHAHESPRAMTVPLLLLVIMCAAGALAPGLLLSAQAPLLTGLVGPGGGAAAEVASGSLLHVVVVDLALLIAIVLVGALVWRRVRGATAVDTWGCGYAAPSPRMQYTGRSFSEILTARVLPRWLRARMRVTRPQGPFPAAASFSSDSVDPLTRGTYEPLFKRSAARFERLHWLQRGSLHAYILYILAVTVIALLWAGVRDTWWSP